MGGIYTLITRQPCTSANLQIFSSARATPTTLVISSEVLCLLCGCHGSQWQGGRSLPASTALLLQVSNAVPAWGDSHEASPCSCSLPLGGRWPDGNGVCLAAHSYSLPWLHHSAFEEGIRVYKPVPTCPYPSFLHTPCPSLFETC